jgi:hypothetical protein
MPTPIETLQETAGSSTARADARCSDAADPVACDTLSVQLLGLARRVAPAIARC